MPKFDPTYGDLLSAREVSEATGFTMNQLRNWRIPARHDKAPFGFLQFGAAPYYRKVVIDAWLERNGGGQPVKVVSLGIDDEFPIERDKEENITKRKHLLALSAITTANQFYRWGSTLGDILQENYGNGIYEHSRRLYGMWKGLSPEEAESLTHIPRGRMTTNLEQYYVGSTLATRRLWANTQGWDVTDAEIVAIPIGDIPPIKETNK